ncbi:nuclear receptor subfamily 2 group E member 1 [Schistocerca nitens]|uniref:nuclear receptor subfamily 2 group E member 1 n=1 Tax=Schistocerca nitens TaxID=7011 RepID=UPI002118D6B2|nr:nuclear receptor subfamily 2 group E member 1 [Schistocerca nitens]
MQARGPRTSPAGPFLPLSAAMQMSVSQRRPVGGVKCGAANGLHKAGKHKGRLGVRAQGGAPASQWRAALRPATPGRAAAGAAPAPGPQPPQSVSQSRSQPAGAGLGHREMQQPQQESPQPLAAMHPFDPRVSPKISPGASSRILYDIPCKVCQDHSSGKHYGIFACDGCAGFFKRSIRRARQYVCKAKAEGSCVVDKTRRNQCRACRLHKCLQAGMNKDAVQHERGPRNSTLRRQLALYLKEPAQGQCSPPPPPPPLLPPTFPLRSVEAVCESAARLLFMNVQWAKSVTGFTALPMNDQLLLLEESWRDLFVVGAAQLMLPLDVSQLAALLGSSRSLALLHQLRLFQEALLRFAHMAVDAHEYACLRAIVLFKTVLETPGRRLEAPEAVCAQQEAQQRALGRYTALARPQQPFRLGKLLLLLPAVRQVAPDTIEELFFRSTIGNIPIHRIICDMYRTGADPAVPHTLPAASPEL